MQIPKEHQRRNIFRCQYQKGTQCISVVVTNENKPISVADVLIALFKLAMKVKNEINPRTGGRVALQVLKIHEKFIEDVKNLRIGNGSSVSYYLNKSGKSKLEKSERIDLEFIGESSIDDKNHIISEYIEKYSMVKKEKQKHKMDKKKKRKNLRNSRHHNKS